MGVADFIATVETGPRGDLANVPIEDVVIVRAQYVATTPGGGQSGGGSKSGGGAGDGSEGGDSTR